MQNDNWIKHLFPLFSTIESTRNSNSDNQFFSLRFSIKHFQIEIIFYNEIFCTPSLFAVDTWTSLYRSFPFYIFSINFLNYAVISRSRFVFFSLRKKVFVHEYNKLSHKFTIVTGIDFHFLQFRFHHRFVGNCQSTQLDSRVIFWPFKQLYRW